MPSITGNIADATDEVFPSGKLLVTLEASDAVTEGTVTGGIRFLPPKTLTVDPATGNVSSASDIPATVDGAPLYRLTVEGRSGNGEKRDVRMGWFPLTADRTLDWIRENTLTPTYVDPATVTDLSALAADAEAAKVAAEAARDAAVDISNIDTSDGVVEALIENPASATATALSATFVGADKLGGLLAPPLSGVTTTVRGTTPKVLDAWGGYTWGAQGDDIYRSADNGATWSVHDTTYPGSGLIRLLPTDDGEVIAVGTTTIHKSSGWGTGTVTWSLKVTSNASAYFLEFGIDGDGTKFVSTQYTATRADSRYVHISLDNGSTWTVKYDSVAKHGATLANGSHLHGACYDPHSDRFYITEGHDDGGSDGDIAGVYCSDDDGATWTRAAGMAANPGPTVIVAHPDGLVCGTDNVDNGLQGVVRRDDPADETLDYTWRWVTGRAGLIGFARRGYVEPVTGMVYVSYTSNFADVAPVIAAGTPTSGSLAWTWPTLPVNANDFIANVVVPTQGRLVAWATISGSDRIIRARTAKPGGARNAAAGNLAEGTAEDGSSLAVGAVATTGTAIRSLAVGPNSAADDTQDCTAVGYGATTRGKSGTAVGSGAVAGVTSASVGAGATTTTANEALAVGAGASVTGDTGTALGRLAVAGTSGVAVGRGAAGNSDGVAVGYGATSRATSVAIGTNAAVAASQNESVAIGAGASVTGSTGTAIGRSASSVASGAAIGRGASVAANAGVAIGYAASVASGHGNSIALGNGRTTTDANQVRLGAFHLEVDELAADPTAPAANRARWYVKDNGSGKTQLCVRFPTGAVQVIATEP